MRKKLLIAILSIALLLETVLTLAAFFAKAFALKSMDLPLNEYTEYPMFLVAWFLLFVSLVCAFALWQVVKDKEYTALCYILGIWWIGIGIGIYAGFGKSSNLLTDSLKGVLLIGLTYWNGLPDTSRK